MKKFLVILAVLSMVQVFAAPNPTSPGDSSLSAERASDAVKKNKREAGIIKGAGMVGTGINAVAISSITQIPTASSGTGIASAIDGAANLPPIVFNCF